MTRVLYLTIFAAIAIGVVWVFEATQPPEPLTGEDQASRIEREVTEGVRAKTDATSVTADPATCEEALKRNWLIGDDCPQTKAKIAREEEEQKTFVKSKLRSLNLGEEKTVALTAVAMNFANECDPITHHELGIATAIFMVANRNVFAAADERAAQMRAMGKTQACRVGREVLQEYGMLE